MDEIKQVSPPPIHTNKQNKKEPGRRAMYLVKQVAPPPLLFQFFQFSERVIDCLTQL